MSNVTSTLLRIDPEPNAVVARIKLDPPATAAAGEGAVWLSHPLEDTVSRVDPRTNKVIATIHVGQSPAGIAVSPDAVWVANTLGAQRLPHRSGDEPGRGHDQSRARPRVLRRAHGRDRGGRMRSG